jgi:hypothetical protein
MLTERYTEVESDLKNAKDQNYYESIFFNSESSALATTNHLVKDHFSFGYKACTASDGAIIDSTLLQFQAWDYVGYKDRSCQNWVLREGYRYLREAINNLDYISKTSSHDREYIDKVIRNTTYQGLAIKVLTCLTVEDLIITCKQYPQIITMIESKYDGYTSNYGRGNPLDSVLERLKSLG